MRISIKLNGKDYAIEVDDKCYQPMKMGKTKEGAYKEEILGYFKNIQGAAMRCCREEISSSPDTVTLKEFANRVEALNNELIAQLEAVNV